MPVSSSSLSVLLFLSSRAQSDQNSRPTVDLIDSPQILASSNKRVLQWFLYRSFNAWASCLSPTTIHWNSLLAGPWGKWWFPRREIGSTSTLRSGIKPNITGPSIHVVTIDRSNRNVERIDITACIIQNRLKWVGGVYIKSLRYGSGFRVADVARA